MYANIEIAIKIDNSKRTESSKGIERIRLHQPVHAFAYSVRCGRRDKPHKEHNCVKKESTEALKH